MDTDGPPRGADCDRIDCENILLVTENGWVHNEHNRKLADDGEVVAYGLGWITYRPVDSGRCAAAVEEMPDFAP